MRDSLIPCIPDDEHAQREAPTEVVTEAHDEIVSQAKATEQPSDPKPLVQCTSLPVTQTQMGKARVVDFAEEPLAQK